MKRAKIFFTDLDGTLLNSRKQVSPEDKAAVLEALEQGCRIAVNTGRPLPAVLPLLERTGLNRQGYFAVTYNGGLIYDCGSGETLYKKTLPRMYVRHIFQEAEKQDLYVQTYDSQSLICRRYTEETRLYCEASAIGWREDPDLLNHLREDPVKAVAIDYRNPERLCAFRSQLEPWAAGKVSMYFSSEFLLEFVSQGISKGGAVRFLCGRLGISPEEAVAAGDAENDIPMLQAAGIGAAVANAAPEVKAAADWTSERDCDHSAVSQILHRFLL